MEGRHSAKRCSAGSCALQTFNGTARAGRSADVAVLVDSCAITAPVRKVADRHGLHLVDVDLPGFWNTGTALSSLAEPGSDASGAHCSFRPDHN
jgi:restriction system protein